MTSSFGITPQRQVRDVFERPEEQAKPAAPAQPAQTPQQRGGQMIDVQGYQPDIALRQKVDDISKFVEAGNKFIPFLVEQDAKRQVDNAARAFDQAAQAQVESLEIGEAARQLRKKGMNELADQVVSTNPWFRHGWLTEKGKHAGQQGLIDLQSYVNTHISRLEKIEDPSEVSYELNDRVQNFVRKNYPDIPNHIYKAYISPVFTKGVPQIRSNILERHLKWKTTFAKQEALEGLISSTKTWAATYDQAKDSSTLGAQASGALGQALLNAQAKYISYGFERTDFITNVAVPFLKAVNLDFDEDGNIDVQERGLQGALAEALNIEMPGIGKRLFEMIDPDSGQTLGAMFQSMRNNALSRQNQLENAYQQIAYREATQFKSNLSYTLDRDLANLTGSERSIKQREIFNAYKQAANGDGKVSIFVRDPMTGEYTRQSVSIPGMVTAKDLKDTIFTTAGPVDQAKYIEDLETATARLANNPYDSLSDILQNYEFGTAEYKAIQGKALKSRTNFAEKEWSTETQLRVKTAQQVVSELNAADLQEALSGVNDRRVTLATKANYKAALKAQKLEAEKFAQNYVRRRIIEADPDQLKDPTWWTTLDQDLRDVIPLNESLSTTKQYLPGQKRLTADSLFAEERNASGEVVEATRLLNNENFLRLNKSLFNTNTLKQYYKREPMITPPTANNVAPVLQTGKGSFTPEALEDLRSGFELARALDSSVTLPEFLKAQLDKPVYGYIRDTVKNPIAFDQGRLQELNNRLQTVQTNKSTEVRYDDLNHGGRNDGAIDFHISDKRTGSLNTHFNAPVAMRITSVQFDSGGFGRYSVGEVLHDEGELKAGDLVRIGHAKGFGNLLPGTILYPGQLWGYQHTEKSYQIGIDQAATPGAGVHLHVDIIRNGVRLDQAKTRRIFKDILVKRLAP